MLYDRINAADIARGVVIMLILGLSFFHINNIPLWGDTALNDTSTAKIAATLFPAFIFFYCLTVPFAVSKRINEGLNSYEISRHIFARGLILVTIGVLLVNTVRVNSEETGINRFLWSVLLIAGIFLTWNRYSEKENNFFTTNGLRLAGLAVLVFLFFRFRSGSYENNGSVIPGWWELPGLAGWAFMLSSFTYLFARNSIAWTFAVLALFIGLNILDFMGMTSFMEPVKPYFGVITTGYIPVISLSALLSGILLRIFAVEEKQKTFFSVLALGILLLAGGILFLKLNPSTVVYGNPGWALAASGASALLLAVLFLADEMLGLMKWTMFIKTAGINMISLYIISLLLYNIAGYLKADLLFFSNSGSNLINLAASAGWVALNSALLFAFLKIGIRLKF